MKILIFAGGVGKRLWPLSTPTNPKQFTPLIDNKSTFQLMIERVQPIYGWNNIYISTNEDYVPIVKKQVPEIRTNNIIAEPYCRDVAAGVGFAFTKLRKMNINEPIAILWADGLIKDNQRFIDVLTKSEQLILQNKSKIVFIGEVPKYANNEIGWITVDNKKLNIDTKNEKNIDEYSFIAFEYRPELGKCEKMVKEKNGLWNTGYFVSTVDFILSIYEKYNPQMYSQLVDMEKVFDTERESEVVNKIYPNIEKIHFDHVVPYHIKAGEAVVLGADMGWFDPGTLYALKKYFKPNNENFEQGNVITHNCVDSLIINKEKDKIVASVGLTGLVVINTKDAILVVDKNSVGEIKELLEKIKI